MTSILSLSFSTHQEFFFTSDFNIHVDNPCDQFASQLLSSLSISIWPKMSPSLLTKFSHILDLACCPYSSGLSLILSCGPNSPSYIHQTQYRVIPQSPTKTINSCIDLKAFQSSIEYSGHLLSDLALQQTLTIFSPQTFPLYQI